MVSKETTSSNGYYFEDKKEYSNFFFYLETIIMYQNIILIPYRDRQKHLDYFLQETVPLLHRNLPDSKVIIVEQTPGELFNRGKLLNVGFKEFQDQTNYFITNDVDINPKEKTIQDLYASEIEESDLIRGIYNNKHGTLGGLIKIKHDHIFQSNGCLLYTSDAADE